MKEKKNEKASRQKNGGGGGETSRTVLGETKQHASDNGQGCENSGNEEMLRETPGKITQKQYFCCLHKRHRGEWEGFWQSPCAIRRHKPESSYNALYMHFHLLLFVFVCMSCVKLTVNVFIYMAHDIAVADIYCCNYYL